MKRKNKKPMLEGKILAIIIMLIAVFILGYATVSHALIGPGINTGSCWGRCGLYSDISYPSGWHCNCDYSCTVRGDCCMDFGEYCPVDFPNGAEAICKLISPETQGAYPKYPVYGTDLGITFAHDGLIEVLFGDAWHASNDSCLEPAYPFDPFWFLPISEDDDSSAALPVTRPSFSPDATGSCQGLLDFEPDGAGFQHISLTNQSGVGGDLSLGWGQTPAAGFSDGSTAYGLFLRGEHPFGSTDYYTEIAYRNPYDRSNYVVRERFQTDKFYNVTAETVKTFDPDNPTSKDYSNNNSPSAVFIWGRPSFASAPEYSTKMYLMVHKLGNGYLKDPVTNSFNWQPQFYTGMDSSDNPTFSYNQAEAEPVILSDFKTVNQMDMAYIPEIGKWVMLYGGDLPDWFSNETGEQPRRGAIHMRMADNPWGPWSDPVPVFWRYHAREYLACSNTSNGYDDPLSYAGDDVGEWNFLGLDYPSGYENAISQAIEGDCADGDLYRLSNNMDCMINMDPIDCLINPPYPTCEGSNGQSIERGNMYAPNIISQWTRAITDDRGLAAEIYINVSTWNPYQIIMAKMTVRVPENDYVRWGKYYHLISNDNNPLLSTTRESKPHATVSGFDYYGYDFTYWRFEKVSGADKDFVSIGDTVRIKDCSGRYLRHDTSWATLSTSTSSTDWVIVRAGGPSGRVLLNGGSGQKVYLQRQRSDGTKSMKSKNSGNDIRIMSGTGGSATWRVGWGYLWQ